MLVLINFNTVKVLSRTFLVYDCNHKPLFFILFLI